MTHTRIGRRKRLRKTPFSPKVEAQLERITQALKGEEGEVFMATLLQPLAVEQQGGGNEYLWYPNLEKDEILEWSIEKCRRKIKNHSRENSRKQPLFKYERWKVRTKRQWWGSFCRTLRNRCLVRKWFAPMDAAEFVYCDGDWWGRVHMRVADGYNDRRFYSDDDSLLCAIENWNTYLCPFKNDANLTQKELENCLIEIDSDYLFTEPTVEQIELIYRKHYLEKMDKTIYVDEEEGKIDVSFMGESYLSIWREEIEEKDEEEDLETQLRNDYYDTCLDHNFYYKV